MCQKRKKMQLLVGLALSATLTGSAWAATVNGEGYTHVWTDGNIASQSNIASLKSDVDSHINTEKSTLNTTLQNLIETIEAENAKDRTANKTYTQSLMLHMNQMAKAQQEAKERLYETNNSQMPPSMPCGGKDCTGQPTVAHALAGGGGVFGTGNAISGYTALNSDIDTNLTAKVSARQPLKSYGVQCTDFESAKEMEEGVCPDPAKASSKPNLDILGTTLLSMPKVGHDETHQKLDHEALTQLVANLVQAPPVGVRTKRYYKTISGQALEGRMFAARARVSLARTVLDQIAAMDTQHKDFGKDFAKSMNKKLIVPTKLAKNASLMQALAWQDQATYGNRKWYQQIAKMSRSALAKEHIILQAQQLQYQYIAFRQRTNIEAILATLLAEKSEGLQKKVNQAIVSNLANGPGKSTK